MSFPDTRTPYPETEALLAVMEDRTGEALVILDDDFLPGELARFRRQLTALVELAERVATCRLTADDRDAMALTRAWGRE